MFPNKNVVGQFHTPLNVLVEIKNNINILSKRNDFSLSLSALEPAFGFLIPGEVIYCQTV